MVEADMLSVFTAQIVYGRLGIDFGKIPKRAEIQALGLFRTLDVFLKSIIFSTKHPKKPA